MARIKTSLAINLLISIFAGLCFAFIILANPKVSVFLSLVVFITPILWMLSNSFDEKKTVLLFIFIYPLLPSLAGVTLGGGLPALKAQRLATMVLLFILFRKRILFKYYFDFFKANIYTYPIIFSTAPLFFSAMLSVSRGSSIFWALSFVVEIIIFPVIVYNAFRTDKDINDLVKVLCYSGLILCGFGIFERITHYNFFSVFGVFDRVFLDALIHQMRDGQIRIIGSFNHSIAFGAYFALLIPLFLYRYKDNFVKLNTSLGLLMITILFTQSRGALLISVIIFILYFLFIEKKNLAIIMFFMIPLLMLNFDAISSFLMNINPLTSKSKKMADSSNARMDQLLFLITFIKERLYLGHGISTVPVLTRFDGTKSQSIDNFYLLYTYYFGLIGLLSFFYLMISVIAKPFRVIGKQIFQDKILRHLLIAILGFYIINIFVALWSYHFLFWIYTGMITRILVNKRDKENA